MLTLSFNHNLKLVSHVMGNHLARLGEHFIIYLGEWPHCSMKKKIYLICKIKALVK
jgi:hypothetical protein